MCSFVRKTLSLTLSIQMKNRIHINQFYITKIVILLRSQNGMINLLFKISHGICLLILLFVFLQIFCFSTFKIPSDSMSPALESGDNVLVCKPILGARIFNIFSTLRNERTTIYRTPGIKKIERNNILVFNFPCPNHWDTVGMHILKYYIKRCVGLPGDTVSIDNGFYHVRQYKGCLGNRAAQERISKQKKELFEGGVYHSFPYDTTLNWNIQHFGPLYIPKKGDSIWMNRLNYTLYKKYIEWEQQGSLSFQNTSVYLNNKQIDTYLFQKNYYFMAGDNGENSQDSRYWGLLPEEYIVGKAWLIWKSIDPYSGEFRWKRLFKLIE